MQITPVPVVAVLLLLLLSPLPVCGMFGVLEALPFLPLSQDKQRP